MSGAWCIGGKWKRRRGGLATSELIQRVANRYGKDKKAVTAIVDLLWEETWAALVEHGSLSLPGITLKLQAGKIRGCEYNYGKRMMKINLKHTPKGRLKARLDAMKEALNADDSFMDALLPLEGDAAKNPFYPRRGPRHVVGHQDGGVLNVNEVAVNEQNAAPANGGASGDDLVAGVADLDDAEPETVSSGSTVLELPDGDAGSAEQDRPE